MKRAAFTLLVLAALAAAGQAAYGPPEPEGTIAGPYGDANLGGSVTFETFSDGLKGWQYPMVVVYCYLDADGDGVVTTDPNSADLVYAQLDDPETTFVMGGGWSPWLEMGGGDATCNAVLYAYPGFHKADIVYLAATEYWTAVG